MQGNTVHRIIWRVVNLENRTNYGHDVAYFCQCSMSDKTMFPHLGVNITEPFFFFILVPFS